MRKQEGEASFGRLKTIAIESVKPQQSQRQPWWAEEPQKCSSTEAPCETLET